MTRHTQHSETMFVDGYGRARFRGDPSALDSLRVALEIIRQDQEDGTEGRHANLIIARIEDAIASITDIGCKP